MTKIQTGVPAGSFGDNWLATALEHGWAIGAGMILLGAGMLAMLASRSRERAARERGGSGPRPRAPYRTVERGSARVDRGPANGDRARPHPPAHSEDGPASGA